MSSSNKLLLAVLLAAFARAAGSVGGGLLLVVAAAPAVPATAKMMEDTVATVNGSPILLSEYQKELSTNLDFWSKNEPEAMRDSATVKKLKESTLEELINRELLFQEGGKLKLKVRERDLESGIMEIKSRFAPENSKELPEAEAQAKAEEAFKKQLELDGLSFPQFRERLSKQIMARKLIQETVRTKVQPPDEKKVKEYFDSLKSFLASKSTETPKGLDEEEAAAFRQTAAQIKAMSSERVRVSRILVKISPGASENEKKRALKTAEALKKRVDAGAESFGEIARAESEDPESAARGGDIGYVVRGVAPAEFEKVAFSLPVGEVSEPILTEIGYHIIRVQEKRAAETPDFERFKDELAKFLMELQFQKELQEYIKGLRAKAVIERSPTTTIQ